MRVALLLLLLGLTGLACADDLQGFVVNVDEENDLFVVPETDKHYTQGLHLTFLWPDDDLPFHFGPLNRVPVLGMTDVIRKYGFQVGQNIYTPVDIITNQPSLTDRPYAGWLWLGLIRDTRGVTAGTIPTLDHLQLDLGVVGPDSLADDSQTWFHGLIQIHEPSGWKYELKSEPGLALRFNRRWLLWDTGDQAGLRAQLIPNFGANLGNIDTSANLGALMRVGHNIPDDFGKHIEPAWGWYVFNGVAGHGVLRNEFLDGDLFYRSRSVAKEPAFVEWRCGLVVELQQMEISYTYNYHSPEFKLQNKYDAFGSLDVTYRF